MFIAACALTIFLFNSAADSGAGNQTVIKYSGAEKSLGERFDWAANEAKNNRFRDGYWTAYSIRRMMNKNSTIGSFSSNLESGRPSLGELITGITDPTDNSANIREMKTGEDGKAMKDVAVCVHCNPSGDKFIDDIIISNLNLRVELNGDPLIWIGQAKDAESIYLLKKLYPSCGTADSRGEIITAVGLHAPSGEALDFLSGIIRGSGETELREKAVFWTGQQNTAEALGILSETISKDPSTGIREHAVFSVSQMKLEEATDLLISLVRNALDKEVRSKAIFWLGQKASAKTEKIIEDVIYNEGDTELQKQALFTLAQSDPDKAVPLLIKIAHSHPQKKIRKEAIFWLGNSEDPKALETLIDIIKE